MAYREELGMLRRARDDVDASWKTSGRWTVRDVEDLSGVEL